MQKQSNGTMMQEFFGGRRLSFSSLVRRGSVSSLRDSQSLHGSQYRGSQQGSVAESMSPEDPVQILYEADGLKRHESLTASTILGSLARNSRKIGIEPADTAEVTPQAMGSATGQLDNNPNTRESISIENSHSTDHLLVAMTKRFSGHYSGARVGVEPVEPVSAVTAAAAGAAYQVNEDTPAEEGKV